MLIILFFSDSLGNTIRLITQDIFGRISHEDVSIDITLLILTLSSKSIKLKSVRFDNFENVKINFSLIIPHYPQLYTLGNYILITEYNIITFKTTIELFHCIFLSVNAFWLTTLNAIGKL